jgi:hypothetical protein
MSAISCPTKPPIEKPSTSTSESSSAVTKAIICRAASPKVDSCLDEWAAGERRRHRLNQS